MVTTMDKELYETAKEVYELSKHKRFQCSFELECKFFAQIFKITIKHFYAFLDIRAQILSRLPQEILTMVGDMRQFAWGHMSKQTQTLLKNFLKECEQ